MQIAKLSEKPRFSCSRRSCLKIYRKNPETSHYCVQCNRGKISFLIKESKVSLEYMYIVREKRSITYMNPFLHFLDLLRIGSSFLQKKWANFLKKKREIKER